MKNIVLDQLMRTKKISKMDLAEKLYASENAVDSWIYKSVLPSAGALEKMAVLFGLSVQQLLDILIVPHLDISDFSSISSLAAISAKILPISQAGFLYTEHYIFPFTRAGFNTERASLAIADDECNMIVLFQRDIHDILCHGIADDKVLFTFHSDVQFFDYDGTDYTLCFSDIRAKGE